MSARLRRQPRQRPVEHASPDLGAAAAAAHGVQPVAVFRFPFAHGRQVLVAPHEAPINPQLPMPGPAPGSGKSASGSHRPAVAGADQAQGAALGPKAARRATFKDAAQISGQRRTGAHRVNTGLGTSAVVEVGDVPGGVHPFVGHRPQGGVHADKALAVGGQPAVAHPGWRLYAGHPEQMVKRHRLSIRKAERFGRSRCHQAANQDDARLGQLAEEQPSRQAAMAGQNVGGHHPDVSGIRQRSAGGQGQFKAPCPAADQHQLGVGADAAAQIVPFGQKPANGLDANAELHRGLGCRPAVDGQQVKANGWPLKAVDQASLQV